MKVKANEKDGLMHIVAPQKLSRNIMTCTSCTSISVTNPITSNNINLQRDLILQGHFQIQTCERSDLGVNRIS